MRCWTRAHLLPVGASPFLHPLVASLPMQVWVDVTTVASWVQGIMKVRCG